MSNTTNQDPRGQANMDETDEHESREADTSPGPVDIYWEYQADRPAHKFSRAIKCF